jgi:uroporphyrinogen-III synthase
VRGPLSGRRILVTRRWPELAAALGDRGASVAEVPATVIVPPEDTNALDEALRALPSYDWLVFTSANAVEAVGGRMAALGVTFPRRLRLASLGPATTRAVGEAWPRVPVFVQPPDDFRAESLVEAFAAHDLTEGRILLPVSDRAADTVQRGLATLGARVHRVIAYRTVPSANRDLLLALLDRGVDAAVFASPSAVEGFLDGGGEGARRTAAVAIGPTTADAARAAGLGVLATADQATVEGLVQALLRTLGGGPATP